MKVFATTAIDQNTVATYLPLFEKLALKDKHQSHSLVKQPEDADIVLFLDGHQHYLDLRIEAIRRHPVSLAFREKVFVYSEVDQPWGALPGLYVSMPRRSFDRRRQRACSYLNLKNEFVEGDHKSVEKDLLFSCLARNCHGVRERVLRLRHRRAVVEDTSGVSFFGAGTDEVLKMKRRYAEIVRRSKFVICPRGSGLSSFRLFETLASGSVPVIVSDEWVEVEGPEWSECAIRVPERDIEKIPSMLVEAESQFELMGSAAKRAWRDWFSESVLFHHMIEGCKSIIYGRRRSDAAMVREFNPRFARLLARERRAQIAAATRSYN